jgi:hypothetical protein
MIDPNQRRTNWQIKTDTARMKETLDALRPDMLKHYEVAVVSLCEMETKARQTLNAAGVHTIFYVPYLNYARQLYKLSRQQGISGESFAWPGLRRPCPNPNRGLRCRLSDTLGRGPSRALRPPCSRQSALKSSTQ